MKRTYLVVFEQGKECWGAFAPDVPGTGGMGDTIEEARQSLLEGIGYVLEHNVEHGLPIPEAVTKTVDFAEITKDPSEDRFAVEWLTLSVPELSQRAA